MVLNDLNESVRKNRIRSKSEMFKKSKIQDSRCDSIKNLFRLMGPIVILNEENESV